ncbi:TetR/AcrR family transcriptional regulator [Streptomyces sp. MUM 203J]|uniref:ScbR family autoregulator-binding transcription factor n=1 Tax=Streptomyces sp. MUM 203J TaxID=2791990 RepID=UPI001F043BEE|nr:ScbR family autoregulator-binding transcription factor [Streptomyces sp. MUM 203J]MCH0538612.1 TetR/AcrR family transcriptional regulator [Streptomyces sp. MUM 203J]
MAQQERAVRTRRAILEAAAAVFDERGYEAATIADILARAGVTKGALYFHFPSKQLLAQGVIDEQFAEGGVPDRDIKLQQLLDMSMVLAYRMRREPMLSAGARLSLGPATRRTFGGGSLPGWIELTRELLDQAKNQGELLPHVDTAATAWILTAAWTGTQSVSETLADREDFESRVADLYRHIYPSIATPAVLARIDMSPERGAQVIEEMSAQTPARDEPGPAAAPEADDAVDRPQQSVAA